MSNLQLRKKKDLSIFRRVALGTWKTVGDPSVYGSLTLHMDEAMRYRDEFRAKTGKRLTITHMMAKAVGCTFEAMPDANAILRFGHPYLRDEIGVFFQVASTDETTGEIDLSGITIRKPNEKSLEDIVDEFDARLVKVRKGTDAEIGQARKPFKRIPYFLIGLILKAISYVTLTLNISLKWAGIPRDPFGSVMITNIGSLGLEEAYVPLVPYSRVPLLLALGEVKEVPIVKDGEVTIGQLMKVFATFDHRLLDGSHAAIMSRTLKEWFQNPYEHFGALD
jgi:pyruvate dehydrogenase E2 component (dihydrolipoamide acetyltransferase)